MDGVPERWRNRIVGEAQVDPADLLVNPYNWRLHPKTQRNAIGAVLNEVGWVRPVIVNKVSGHIVDGHARVQEAIRTGQEFVPVAYVQLSQEEEQFALASLDVVGELTDTDFDARNTLLDTVQAATADLEEYFDTMRVGEIEDLSREGVSGAQRVRNLKYRCYVGEFTFRMVRTDLAAWQRSFMKELGTDNAGVIQQEILQRLGIDGYMGQ